MLTARDFLREPEIARLGNVTEYLNAPVDERRVALRRQLHQETVEDRRRIGLEFLDIIANPKSKTWERTNALTMLAGNLRTLCAHDNAAFEKGLVGIVRDEFPPATLRQMKLDLLKGPCSKSGHVAFLILLAFTLITLGPEGGRIARGIAVALDGTGPGDGIASALGELRRRRLM